MGEFSGKTAVITGGSRGIGAAIAKKFASMGADVAVLYAGNTEKAEAVCQACAAFGVKAVPYQCDVSDFQAVKETVTAIKKEFGTVHILVNNAGITKDGLTLMLREKDFDDVLNVNLKGSFNMIRHISGLMVRNRYGRIINISSVSGMMGNAGQANYSASKAGIIGLTKSIARELAPKGITCNAVAPGFVETEMTENLGDAGEQLMKTIPLGRLAKPEEIADAAAFLATADYITGEVLRVDGGIAM